MTATLDLLDALDHGIAVTLRAAADHVDRTHDETAVARIIRETAELVAPRDAERVARFAARALANASGYRRGTTTTDDDYWHDVDVWAADWHRTHDESAEQLRSIANHYGPKA